MRVICLGEALIDFISTELVPLAEATQYQRCLGGAAVNVAVGLQCHGIETSLVSRVGRDKLGKLVLLELERWGLSTQYVQIDPVRPTKCSFISHDKEGHRFIEIANRQSADQQIDAQEMQSAFERKFDALYISGVMLIQERGRELVMQSIQKANSFGALVVFDPVFDIARASESIKRRIIDVVSYVDVLKVNDAEYEALADTLSDRQIGPELILLTKGKDGAHIRSQVSEVNIEAVPAMGVDPTGAGDAFLASFLANLLKKNKQFNDESLRTWGESATHNASRIVGVVGGTNGYVGLL